MYCPRCGGKQVSDQVRFCVKCGQALGNAKLILADGVESLSLPSGIGSLSPRAKGVLQGVAIIPVGVGALFLLDIFYETVLGAGIMGGIFAIFTLILLVSIVRTVYALYAEEGKPRILSEAPENAQLDTNPNLSNAPGGDFKALDLAPAPIETGPLSVTENTTHKLKIKR